MYGICIVHFLKRLLLVLDFCHGNKRQRHCVPRAILHLARASNPSCSYSVADQLEELRALGAI